MKRLMFTLALVPSLAWAQTPSETTPQPNAVDFLQKIVASLQKQRDAAMNQAAMTEAQNQAFQEQIAALQAKVTDLEKKQSVGASPNSK